MNRTLVSIVAPVFNESPVLPEFVSRVSSTIDFLTDKYLFEIILVDDGSTDHSVEVGKSLMRFEPRLKIIELKGHYGQTAALRTGFDVARGKIIITLDSDLQHFPEEIPFFLERIDSGVDVVCGWRAERKEGVLRRWPSWVANLLLRKLSGLKIHDIGTTYRAYRAEIAKNIVLFGDSHRFIPILAQELGATIEEIKIKNIGRSVGRSNYGLSRTFDICLDMVFIYFSKHYSNRPLRFFGKLSAICGFLSMISAVLFCWLLSVEGFSLALAKYSWILAAAIVAFAIAIFNLALGVLGEATTRTYHVMQRSDVSRTLNEHSHHRS